MVNIQFKIIGTEASNDYNVAQIKDNYIIFLRGKGYLITTEMGDIGSQISCPRCNDGESHNISSIAVGSGKMFGLIACKICNTLIVCKFDKTSERILKETFELENGLIDSKWEDMESIKIH